MYSINMNDVLMNLGIAYGSSPWNLNDRTLTLRCPDTKESENTQLSRPWGHGQEKKGHLPLGCYQKPQNQQNNQNTNEKTGTAFHEQKAFDTFVYDVISVMYIYIYIYRGGSQCESDKCTKNASFCCSAVQRKAWSRFWRPSSTVEVDWTWQYHWSWTARHVAANTCNIMQPSMNWSWITLIAL